MWLHAPRGVGDEPRILGNEPPQGRVPLGRGGGVEIGVDPVMLDGQRRSKQRRKLCRLEAGRAEHRVRSGDIHRDRSIAGALVHRSFEVRGEGSALEFGKIGDVGAGIGIPPLAIGDIGGTREQVPGEHAGTPARMCDDHVGSIAGRAPGERGADEALGIDRRLVHRLGVGMGFAGRLAVRLVAQDAEAGRACLFGRCGEGDLPAVAGEPETKRSELGREVVVDEEDLHRPAAAPLLCQARNKE